MSEPTYDQLIRHSNEACELINGFMVDNKKLIRERDGYRELLSVLVEACEKVVDHQSEYTTFAELEHLNQVLTTMKPKLP